MTVLEVLGIILSTLVLLTIGCILLYMYLEYAEQRKRIRDMHEKWLKYQLSVMRKNEEEDDAK